MPKTAEERAAYKRRWYVANRERIQERDRQYWVANRERLLERHREYHAANREAIREQQREYRADNREAVAAYHREYMATPEGKKKATINNWKQMGLICDDYSVLYDDYLACEQCMDCGKEFTGVLGDGSGAFRCMDHDHTTGQFRAFVCPECNQRRRYEDAAAAAAAPAPSVGQ
jgi:DNA-directed RNA polymerase subunit RPC12/RpoP